MENDILELLRKMDDKIDKNTLMLEQINQKMEIIAEVQTSFQEQLGRANEKDKRTLMERLGIIELAVSDTSGRVKDIQKDLARVVRATGENWAEIVELKAVK